MAAEMTEGVILGSMHRNRRKPKFSANRLLNRLNNHGRFQKVHIGCRYRCTLATISSFHCISFCVCVFFSFNLKSFFIRTTNDQTPYPVVVCFKSVCSILSNYVLVYRRHIIFVCAVLLFDFVVSMKFPSMRWCFISFHTTKCVNIT